MSNKCVSVNVTTYNRAHLLPRCLCSILSQSYNNIEVIIVDDCSQDNTQEVVEEFQRKDERIRYFRHETNMGNAHARNTALAECTGHYVAFMDDDDEWVDDDKIKDQVELFESSKNGRLGLICSNPRIYINPHNYTDKIIRRPKNLVYAILIGNSLIYNSTCLTKKSIITEVGGFDVNLPRGIDSDFYRNCIVKHDYDVCFMNDITTAVHEYGVDRITPTNNKRSLYNNLQANVYLIKKYFFYYLKYPKALFVRIKTILVTLLKYWIL